MADAPSGGPPPSGFNAVLQKIWKGESPVDVARSLDAAVEPDCPLWRVVGSHRPAGLLVSPQTNKNTVLVYLEDKLADLFGLNTPKYYWALEELEYRQRKARSCSCGGNRRGASAVGSEGRRPLAVPRDNCLLAPSLTSGLSPRPSALQEKEEASALAEREKAADGASGSGAVEMTDVSPIVGTGVNQV